MYIAIKFMEGSLVRILSKVDYTLQDHRNFPSVFPDAYDISSVLLYVKNVYLSRALVDEISKQDCAGLFAELKSEDSIYVEDISDYIPRSFIVQFYRYSLKLEGSHAGEYFYLVDVLFNGRSMRAPTNMRSAYLYLDTETIQLNNSDQKKLAPY